MSNMLACEDKLVREKKQRERETEGGGGGRGYFCSGRD